MSKQFIAHIPARALKGATKNFTYPARDDLYQMDDAGRWSVTMGGMTTKLHEDEVISSCRKASNWLEIKAEHFPMDGFHDDAGVDKTPAVKLDY